MASFQPKYERYICQYLIRIYVRVSRWEEGAYMCHIKENNEIGSRQSIFSETALGPTLFQGNLKQNN